MSTTHYSISYLQSKITVTKDSHFSGKPYVYSMRYRRRLVCWRDDSACLYDIASDPSLAETTPIAYKAALNVVYNRLVDKYYDTFPSKLLF